jgi:hypothetical protein
MKIFTIDADNNITACPTPELADAAKEAGAQVFSTQPELAELVTSWPPDRLLAVLNSLPGQAEVKKVKNPKTAIGQIWSRIQDLGEPVPPLPKRQANVSAQVAHGAPVRPRSSNVATSRKKAPKPPHSAKRRNKPEDVREGSKTAKVVDMLRRKGGATLAEIATKMGWQNHTVRGFMAGTMKKSGFKVESFTPEGGKRTYRISK